MKFFYRIALHTKEWTEVEAGVKWYEYLKGALLLFFLLVLNKRMLQELPPRECIAQGFAAMVMCITICLVAESISSSYIRWYEYHKS